ncbi:hypothetical protein [Myxococcus phage Mx1]|nr:hypothetical protein [Myxococcus phage Mx1]
MFLDGACNLKGSLSPVLKARIMNFMVEPSVDAWDDIAGLIIYAKPGERMITVWAALGELDPKWKKPKPQRGWRAAPLPLLVARAIKRALDTKTKIV